MQKGTPPKWMLDPEWSLFWPLHEEPYDFFRVTKYGFEQLLEDAGFLKWQILEDGGD